MDSLCSQGFLAKLLLIREHKDTHTHTHRSPKGVCLACSNLDEKHSSATSVELWIRIQSGKQGAAGGG